MTGCEILPENHDVGLDFHSLAEAIHLREGVEGIQRALWMVYSRTIHSTREWSRVLHIPVPVLAALRRELEKIQILETGQGLVLTETGRRQLETVFGGMKSPPLYCTTCGGSGRILPAEAMGILEEFRSICEQRPEVDVTLDQSHATPETGIRKALFLLEKGLLGYPLFFLGDDDLISVACWLARKRFISDRGNCGPLFVADIDERYLETIRNITHGQIEVQPYDARTELPVEWRGKFSAALTDPAYTENAVIAFAYRCLCAVNESGSLYLSMPIQDANALGAVQYQLLEMGWGIHEILPRFNEYLGASLHAHVSGLFVCKKWKALPPDKSRELRYTPFYTGEVRLPGGRYECTLCATVIEVGLNESYATIRELKKDGCPECGNPTFRRLGKEHLPE
ncbi:MAG: putative methyltransferase [Candidatus Omnitrophota bacterium]|jgi:predicted methyltransferase|nr:MAG: putative methyltransferase [Candidatus Omnitrophota bacterium]